MFSSRTTPLPGFVSHFSFREGKMTSLSLPDSGQISGDFRRKGSEVCFKHSRKENFQDFFFKFVFWFYFCNTKEALRLHDLPPAPLKKELWEGGGAG